MKLYETLEGAAKDGYAPKGHPEVIIIPAESRTKPEELQRAYSAAMTAAGRTCDALLLHVGLTSDLTDLNQIIKDGGPNAAAKVQPNAVRSWAEELRPRLFRALELDIHVVQPLTRTTTPPPARAAGPSPGLGGGWDE